MKQPHSFTWWSVENEWIKRVDPVYPGREFNFDSECFARYCNMQANSAERDGFPLIAEDMRQARDIAHPTFRTEARRSGKRVDGTRVS